ncbi:MAG: cytidine deaminase [Candidatus Aminicenantes bacterium]|nr:MAG: cytidine deaminase [Candidatus Aminicenantes bacterium]
MKTVERLLEAAQKVKENAYAPYSHFHVGAALLTDTGKIYAGCNVENTSYGLTICAERNAVFQMISNGERRIVEVLVIGDTEEFLPPCGACRQVMTEFSTSDTVVYLCNKHGQWKKTTMGELMPYTFFLNR